MHNTTWHTVYGSFIVYLTISISIYLVTLDNLKGDISFILLFKPSAISDSALRVLGTSLYDLLLDDHLDRYGLRDHRRCLLARDAQRTCRLGPAGHDGLSSS